MRLRCSAAAGHIRRFAPNPAGQGYVPMPDYLVAFYDSGGTIGRIGRGLQVRLPAVFWDIRASHAVAGASPKTVKIRLTLNHAAPHITSRLRVESQDTACYDGASIGSQSMCAISQFSKHADASVKSCIARLGYNGSDAFNSQLPPLMCVCAGALGHGVWTRRQPLHRHG